MVTRWAHWRLLSAIAMVALAGVLSAGLVAAAQRARTSKAATAAPREVAQKAAVPVVPATGVEITYPESDAKVRGVVPVKVSWRDPRGYVIFRIDDAFVYASTAPYVMQWDTSNLMDGPHVVSVDAFDASAKYEGSSSIRLEVANALPMPANGVLLSLRFGLEDSLKRQVSARGELSSLASDQVLPAGFDVLAGSLSASITQSVMDPFYKGTAVLMRNSLRGGWLTVVATRTSLPTEYAMVEVSRNGLTIPDLTATRKTRLPWGEISLALPDYPVFPGDTWEAPIGTVVDLYTKRSIYVSAQHTFEGLRWYGGKECGVVTSEYRVAAVPLFEAPVGGGSAATRAAATGYGVELTQMRGGGMRGGGMRGGGMRGGGMRGGGMRGGGMRGGAQRGGGQRGGAAGGGAAGGRGGGTQTLLEARLVRLEGKRTTYIIVKTGRVLHTEDTVRGQVEFKTTGGQQTAASPSYSLQLTGAMGGGMRGGGMRGGGMRGGGMRGGGMRGGGMRGGGMRGGGGQRGGGAGRGGAAQPTARRIPDSVGYTFRLTTELVSAKG